MNTDHVAIGDGSIDWKEFFRVLKLMGYDGYLGLDLGMTPSLLDDYRKSVDRIQAIAGELDLKIEV